jgi:hypothetical protein
MTKEDYKPEPYRTSDTPFAAYLHYSGKRVVTTRQDPNDYKREVVVFLLDADIPELEVEWRKGTPTGELKTYHRSLKIVNRLVNEARKKREK